MMGKGRVLGGLTAQVVTIINHHHHHHHQSSPSLSLRSESHTYQKQQSILNREPTLRAPGTSGRTPIFQPGLVFADRGDDDATAITIYDTYI